MNSGDLAALADLLRALNSWATSHPGYHIDGTTVWGEGDEVLAVGLGEDGEYVTYHLDAN